MVGQIIAIVTTCNVSSYFCLLLNHGFSREQIWNKNCCDKKKINSVKDLLFGSYVIHHSHVTGEIVGYAHDFCNKKLRETQNFIPVFAYNLFSFDFFFAVKGIRHQALCLAYKAAKYQRIEFENVQYANIGLQVKFIDTIKYY